MKVVAYDTGKLTGIGMWRPSNAPLGDVWSTHLERDEAEDHMELNIPNADVCVIEKLVISEATVRKSRELQPAIEMVGVARRVAKKAGVQVVEQMPAEVMKFARDDMLRRIGWYVTGPDHQRDVRRHILVFISKNRLIDLSTLLPKEG